MKINIREARRAFDQTPIRPRVANETIALMSVQPNWVQRRLNRMRIVEAGRTELWGQITMAIREACESFNQYCQSGSCDVRQIEMRIESVDRIRLKYKRETTDLFDNETEFSVQLNAAQNAIFTAIIQPRIRGDGITGRYPIQADDDIAYVFNAKAGSRLTTDEFSQLILEPILFPAANTGEPARL